MDPLFVEQQNDLRKAHHAAAGAGHHERRRAGEGPQRDGRRDSPSGRTMAGYPGATLPAEGCRRMNDGPKVLREKAKARDKAVIPAVTTLQQQGITSARAIARALNDQGIPAPEGGRWQATQVLRLIRRLSF